MARKRSQLSSQTTSSTTPGKRSPRSNTRTEPTHDITNPQQEITSTSSFEEVATFVQTLKQARSEGVNRSASRPQDIDPELVPEQSSTSESNGSSDPPMLQRSSRSSRRQKKKKNIKQPPVKTKSKTQHEDSAHEGRLTTTEQIRQHKSRHEQPAYKDKSSQHAREQSFQRSQSISPSDEKREKIRQQRPQSPTRNFLVRELTLFPELPQQCIQLIDRVDKYLTTQLAIEAGSTMIVAVSGGVDSVTLLDILYILSYENGYILHIAHVNHTLRGQQSDKDEAFVRRLAQRYDIPCHTTHVHTTKFARANGLSIEEAARELRYRYFRQMCGTLRAAYCAVAHTADDTAETLLMNLFRGAGLTGLAGIPPKRPLTKKAQLIRPLLELSRQEILSYANERHLEWVEDSTNTDRRFLRNRIRQEVLPLVRDTINPRIVDTLQRTATLLRQADGFIESLIESIYHQIASEQDGSIGLDHSQLKSLHPFIQGEIIERAMGELIGNVVSHSAIERVLRLIDAETGTRQSITGEIVALRDRDRIILCDQATEQGIYLPIFKLGTYSIGRYRIVLEEVTRNEVRLGTNPNVEYFDYDQLPYRLFFRTWQAGDRFAPLGMDGKEVLVADFLTNVKVSTTDRRTVIILSTTTEVIWVCGYRISEHFKLTNDTRRIIRATFLRN